MARPRSRPARLVLWPMEDRIVPAFTLTIDGDVPANVDIQADTTTVPGTTIFSPTATGAILDVDAIAAALAVGDVLITTGTGGAEPGAINWFRNSAADDLTDFTSPARTLTLRPDASALAGDVVLIGVNLSFAGNIGLTIDTTAPMADGQIRLTNNTSVVGARTMTLQAGTSTVSVDTLNGLLVNGDVTVNADSLTSAFSGFVVSSQSGDLTVNAQVQTSFGNTTLAAVEGTISLNGAVNGLGPLSLVGKDVTVVADIGAVTPLTAVQFRNGRVNYGAHSISANQIIVGGLSPQTAVLEGTGTLTGTVIVGSGGTVAPGGLGTVGTMTIDGVLDIFSGTYAVDLGPVSDQIVVTGAGDVNLDSAFLGGPDSTGLAPPAVDIHLIDFPGILTGTFVNAPAVGSKLVLGFDAVEVTHYGPAANGFTVAKLPAVPGGVVTGTEFDGTKYTVRLTGPGELVGFVTPFGQLALVARGTAATSKLAVTTKADASDDVVEVEQVRVSGPLAAFTAPRADLILGFAATGPVGALSAARVSGSVRLGGTAASKTIIKAESFLSGSTPDTVLSMPGILTSLTASGTMTAGLSAASVGTVKVGGTLSGLGAGGFLPWTVAGGVGSITAAEIQSVTLTARNLGRLTATGSMAQRLPGNIGFSTFHLTGNDGTAAKYGLSTVKAAGTAESTTFDVQAGNVGTVTVGRFWRSNLYLNYSPGAAFDTGGTFDSAAHFKLGKFTTTAGVIGQPTNLLNWAFTDSQIAADTIGTVRLSGLKTTGGTAFGIKFRTASVSVRTAATDDPVIATNVNLTPALGPLAGNFFFLDV